MLSIIVPGIRPHFWDRLMKSIERSCSYEYEVLFIGPFPPVNLQGPYKYIQSFSPVPVCIQLATLEAKYDLICHAVDDSVFGPSTLDQCMNSFLLGDVMGLTYIENTNDMTDPEKWKIKNAPEFNLPSINQDWSTFVQPMMEKSRFIEIGGFDCSFEYSNHCHHDLAFRLQMLGSTIKIAPVPVSFAYHMLERTGDHGPIHDAQTGPDEDRFREKWSAPVEPKIEYDNYKLYNKPWTRRFKKQYTSYMDMVIDQ